MRKIIFFAIASLLSINIWAQAPQKMSYQAVIRNSSNVLVVSAPIGIQISILQGSSSGTVVYSETHLSNTNANGLISIEIGSGTIVSGTFATINWANGPYFIKTETDPNGGTAYSIVGTSELLSVPYALHSKSADYISGGINETDPVFMASPAGGINSTDIINWNNKLSSEVDGSITNELQMLSIGNDTVYLSNGGFVKLPAGFDGNYNNLTNAPTNVSAFINDAGYLTSFTEVDGSITNELQMLSIGNDTVYLSNGGFVKLPAGFDGNYNNLTNAPTNVSAFINDAGYLTTFSEVDGSITNELQMLSIGNDTVYLSNGGFVKLPAGFDGNYNNLTNAPTNVSAFSNDAGYLTTFSEVDPKVGTNTSNYVSKWNGSSLVTSGIFDNGTNVGIGTATPSFKLDVAGDVLLNGVRAGRGNGNVVSNTALGINALNNNAAGTWNTAIGDQSLSQNTSGYSNTGVGRYSLFSMLTGYNNTSMGSSALWKNSGGNNNTSIGGGSMLNNTSGSANTVIGTSALYNNVAGNSNTVIGFEAGFSNSGSGNVFIGNQSGYSEVGSNKFYLANSSSNPPLIYGDFSSGNVGLGTTSPTTKLQVAGNAKFGASGMINIWDWDMIEKIGLDYNPANGDFNMRNPVAGKRLLGTISTTGSWGIENTSGTEMVRVTGSGNMGVGTTNPTAKFQVESYGLSNKTILGINSMLLQSQNASTRTLFALAPNGTQNADLVIFHNSDYTTNTEYLIMGYENTLNNFIIGTSKGGTGIARRIVMEATGASSNLWKQLVLATNGNVGIGTITPNAALEVNGAVKITGGMASQFLKADGSLDNTAYLTSIDEAADEFTAIASQTNFTLTQTPAVNSKVKMFVNGMRISNTAYSVVGTTVTYIPANNGNYNLNAGDRIQFDFTY